MLCMRAEIPQQQRSPGSGAGDGNTTNLKSTDDSNQKVLLRTRVLLHDNAYQCQGGNIITWCEPFNVHGAGGGQGHGGGDSGGGQPSQQQQQQKSGEQKLKSPALSSSDSATQQQQQNLGSSAASAPATSTASLVQPAGVDLALSFQDNAGCRDIW
mmetsp:Transcript_27315/g.44814  ORF Transcript_27315/g.44814 Transcript_27315/m.44814 type:complete len:156 (-) Transcript_27315:635-1102(-)